MELPESAFGASFWRISARLEQWSQIASPLRVCGRGCAGVTVIYTPFLHFIHLDREKVMQSIGIVWQFGISGNGGKLHSGSIVEGAGL